MAELWRFIQSLYRLLCGIGDGRLISIINHLKGNLMVSNNI